MTADLAVILPVHRDEELLLQRLAELGAMNPAPSQVIACFSELPQVDVTTRYPGVMIQVVTGGRGAQLRAGAELATTSTLLFLHADTALPEPGIAYVTTALATGAHWGAFSLGIDAPGLGYRLLERLVDLRCRLFRLPYGDQALFITRAAYDACGGFSNLPLMEDVDLVRRLNRAGFHFCLIPHRVRTSARRWQRDGIVPRSFRNLVLLFRFLRGTDPRQLAREYQ